MSDPAYVRPPIPDGDRQRQPWPREQLPAPWRLRAAVVVCAVVVLAVMVAGIAGWLS